MDNGKFFNHYALPLCFLLVLYEKYSASIHLLVGIGRTRM